MSGTPSSCIAVRVLSMLSTACPSDPRLPGSAVRVQRRRACCGDGGGVRRPSASGFSRTRCVRSLARGRARRRHRAQAAQIEIAPNADLRRCAANTPLIEDRKAHRLRPAALQTLGRVLGSSATPVSQLAGTGVHEAGVAGERTARVAAMSERCRVRRTGVPEAGLCRAC